ncbi:replication factor-A carboxy-terminal domain protein [Trifolium pratense]|uniref:Replication factor-A carboxy-terminal domain protein n=2 Tax=Trifolium pratense TaxID=57577 RepID=A0A2K3NIR6_TRIPR|nr:replication factor-A carboxy-terminal domain protein [Trifolium pratense]
MEKAFDTLDSVGPGVRAWRFKVRILRLWNLYSFAKPNQLNSIEMVLIDEKGDKIHATVPPHLLNLFRFKLNEGDVYRLFYFKVHKVSGLYRTTPHPYKLIFQLKTKVQSCENNGIDRFGLSLSNIRDICNRTSGHEFLVDVVGLITGISPPKEYVFCGKITPMIVFEMADYSGKCECIMSGDDVGDLEKMLGCGDNGLPLMIVQFAKIRNFRGNVAIQGVLSTRFYVNPSIPEAISFKNGLPIEGVETLSSIPAFGFQPKPAFEDDFLVNYPKISIVNLLESVENGIYVVGATVDGLVEGEDWWYPGCSCARIVSADSGAFYCKPCTKRPFEMVPRFRVKLKVCDGSGQAIFIVFDDDMNKLLGKHCHELVALSKAKNAGYYPPELELLKGIQLLFKVEKNSGRDVLFIGSFRVKRICNDVSVMKAFDSVLGSGDSSSYYGLFVKEEFTLFRII